MNNKNKIVNITIDDVNFGNMVLCAQKGCPNEKNEYSKYCDDCYVEKYPNLKTGTQLSTNNNDSLYNRVVYETRLYDNAFLAAIDHLNMAHSHLFEEFEGRDHEMVLSKLTDLTLYVKNILNR